MDDLRGTNYELFDRVSQMQQRPDTTERAYRKIKEEVNKIKQDQQQARQLAEGDEFLGMDRRSVSLRDFYKHNEASSDSSLNESDAEDYSP